MTMNAKIVAGMISAALHIEFKNSPASGHKELLAIADAIRKCLKTAYPLTDKEWDDVLRDMAHYADCLI